VSLLGENKIAAEGKTIAPEDFAFHRMAATALAVFMLVLCLFSRPQYFEAWLLRITTIACVITTVAIAA
jgi:hypothetical protein